MIKLLRLHPPYYIVNNYIMVDSPIPGRDLHGLVTVVKCFKVLAQELFLKIQPTTTFNTVTILYSQIIIRAKASPKYHFNHLVIIASIHHCRCHMVPWCQNSPRNISIDLLQVLLNIIPSNTYMKPVTRIIGYFVDCCTFVM